MLIPNVGLFLVMAFSLLGPKIGLLDTGFLVSFCYLFLHILLMYRFKIPKQFLIILGAQIVLLSYSLAVSLASQSHELELNIVLRAIRSLSAVVCLGLIFYNTKVPLSTFVRIFLLVLLLHPLTIFYQLIYPESMSFFSEYWTFGKYPPPFRAFGLTAGLDTSGYYCIFGQVVTATLSLRTKNYFGYHCLYLVFLMAVIFTARNAILISLLLYFIYMFKAMQLKRKIVNFYLASQSFFLVSFIIFILVPLMMYSFFDGSNILSLGSGLQFNLSETYARGTVNDILTNHLIIPNEPIDLIFGNAKPVKIDPGYIRLLMTLGIVGLLISMMTYFLLIIMSVSSYRLTNSYYISSGKDEDRRLLFSLIQVLIMYLLLTFVFNFKHFFFFTRGFWEIVVILYFYTLSCLDRKNLTSKF